MTEPEQPVIHEFVRLRHGWGLAATNLRGRIGPHLIDLCDIAPADNDRIIRTKVMSKVGQLAADFTDDDKLTIEITLGAARDVRYPHLSRRVEILAERLICAERAARRRMESAFVRLSQEAVAQRAPDDDPEKGWYVRRFEALLRLDTSRPELHARRTIVAERDNLKKIAFRFTVPPKSEVNGGPRDIDVDVQQGARLEKRERLSSGHFLFILDLPKALARDEAHDYTMVFRTPEGQPMRTHYALVPLVRIDSFQVRVRFDQDRPPQAVWRLHHLAPGTLSDPLVQGEQLLLDDANEVVLEFSRMQMGFGYGLAWSMPDEPSPPPGMTSHLI